MAELEQLRQRDIPEGRQVLRDHHGNLHRVADYCESNYLQASDKRKALEETMALSTQSLASVTYQVNRLATAILRLLDLQAAELRRVEADISCVAQRVDMHKEKVARREIGSLTIAKTFPSYQKIVSPPSPPCLEPYYRRPLNFSVLDDVGHGVKVSAGLGRWPAGVTGLGWALSVPSITLLGAQVGSNPPLMEIWGLPVPLSPPWDSSCWGWSQLGDRGQGPVQQRETEARDAQRRDAPTPTVPFPTPNPPGRKAPMGGGGSAASHKPPAKPPRGWRGTPDDLELPPALPDFEDLAPPPPPAAEDPPWVPESYLEKVVALYPYTRQKDNELSFAPGALLFVTRRYSDGWCEGVTDGEAGFFPGNYVEP
ncbi:ABI3 protein, partial [Pterocles burchelli]|nr:ABI3 protein [Pterocles burchelli]